MAALSVLHTHADTRVTCGKRQFGKVETWKAKPAMAIYQKAKE